jgi:hypothetical protein
MSDADKTPVDGRSTLDMVLEKLGEVGDDAKLAVAEAREAKGHAQNTYNLQLNLNEHVKALDLRVRVVERSRLWLPVAALIVALVALLKNW